MAPAIPEGPVGRVLDRLHKVKPYKSGWVARCPAHDDHDPSLSISEGADGRVLLNCHAGCPVDAIIAELGITPAEMFEPRENGRRTIVATYDYTDENGDILYQAVRMNPKTFRQRRPDGNGDWLWSLDETRRVLYHLPELLTAIENGDPIYIAEGEKDVHALEKAGVTATTNAMGALKWRDTYTAQLAGAKEVIVIADDDDTGRQHAQQISASLQAADIPVRIVLPATGKDAADHLNSGHTLTDFVPLLPTPTTVLRIVTLDQFVATQEETAEPLIGEPDESLLPADGLLLMYGDGGAGKTTLSIDAVAHLASGTPWIGITVPKAVRILLIENEGPRGPFRQRLSRKIRAWKGEPFTHNVNVLEEPWSRFTLTDPDCRNAVADEIGRTNSDLVVVGPLASIGAKGTGTPDEINEFDNLIKDMRQQTTRRFALWIVHHENKAGDVSGAWERYPDSLVHIQGQGNGRTRIYWRKVRWASELHGTSTNLVWADGHSFTVDQKKVRDLPAETKEWLTVNGNPWSTLTELASKKGIGVNKDVLRDVLKTLVPTVLDYEVGPLGRTPNAQCWRLKSGSTALSQSEPVGQDTGDEGGTGSAARPVRRADVSQSSHPHPKSGSYTSEPVESEEADAAEVERLEKLYGNDPT